MQLKLTGLEQRIVGALAEKELTTPEYYPLTLNALVAACNQKSNRDPEMRLTDEEVSRGVSELQYEKKLVGSFSGAGARAVKYTHRLSETLGLERPELAVLSELLLRGPQTAGELRGRASRMHPFVSPAEVRVVLDGLAARSPDPYVVELPRAAGCKENRFAHALGDAPVAEVGAEAGAEAGAVGVGVEQGRGPEAGRGLVDEERIRALEERVASLEARMAVWES